MKNNGYKTAAVSMCIVLFIILAGRLPVKGQQDEPLTLKQIIKILKSKSNNKSIYAINKQIIEDVRKYKVSFELTAKDEKSLKNAQASGALIKAISENTPKAIEEAKLLYQKFTDNYKGTLEQKKLAIDAGKEFVKRYRNNENYKDIIEYFIRSLSVFEESISRKQGCNCSCPVN